MKYFLKHTRPFQNFKMETPKNDPLQELLKKLEIELKCRQAAENLLTTLKDENARNNCQLQVLEIDKRIEYLQNELKPYNLQPNSKELSESNASLGQLITLVNSKPQLKRTLSRKSTATMMEMNPPEELDPNIRHLAAKYSLLYGLSGMDLTKERIAYKLKTLGLKYEIEQQIRQGMDKMSVLAGNTKEKDSKLQFTRIEMLKKALQKYQGVFIEDVPTEYKSHPISGLFTVFIDQVRLPPAIKHFLAPSVQYYVEVRLDTTSKKETKHVKSIKMNSPSGEIGVIKIQEEIKLQVEKVEEFEICLVEQDSRDKRYVGILFGKTSELKELQERKDSNGPTFVEAWFDCDPIGQILMRISIDTNINKMNRQGAVKRQKAVQLKINGHLFATQQFFSVVTCGVCCEFVRVRSQALVCQECKFLCHKKCAPRVFVKCLSSNESENEDVQLLRHSIPHRFTTTTILSTTWCAHCGLLLPLGRKGARKCKECQVCAHDNCYEIIPNLCGLSIRKAYEMIALIKEAKQQAQQAAQNIQNTQNANKMKITPLPDKQLLQLSNKVSLEHFQFLAVLGMGNFGKVMLSEEKSTKQLFAIKVLKKDFVIENDELQSIQAEKRLFQLASTSRHPFLVSLHSCFQTTTRLYFVMEYISGGDLMYHIQQKPFTESQAKFYSCEVLLALEFFHLNKVIYRDLKLDNIMLGLDGHVKIADYGLCKENMGQGDTTNTFCGTPEFMAPEILLEQNYTKSIDWWAFGVLIYEMILGQSPFRGDGEDEIFQSILEDEVVYPINMSKEAISVCQKVI
eukprot:NODE_238_length_11959_cov_0.380270.p1 type:complete len:796 gc:universal NODE_238_length_11959_cov_0.380270:2096-4483(+)